MLLQTFSVDSPNVTYTEDSITSSYEYDTTEVECGPGLNFTIRPVSHKVEFQTARRVPKVGYAPCNYHTSTLLMASAEPIGLLGTRLASLLVFHAGSSQVWIVRQTSLVVGPQFSYLNFLSRFFDHWGKRYVAVRLASCVS
jgi:hypothetical protein